MAKQLRERETLISDFTRKSTVVDPAPKGTQPEQWLRFLERAQPNEEIRNFLQRMSGYCLTGSVGERKLFFFYGPGGHNGKSTYIGTVSSIMGDYALTMPMDVLMDTRDHRHETEIAMLQGVRLATSIETQEGRFWNEAKIKNLTGGQTEPLRARFMRQDFFEFQPEFKILIAGNHKPRLRVVDDSMRDRVVLIPWNVTIPESERDPNFAEKYLQPEWPAILRWMLDGAQKYYEVGLAVPKVIRDASDEYVTSEDQRALWLEENYYTRREDRTFSTSASELFASWRAWAEKANEEPGKQKQLSDWLINQGFEQTTGKNNRKFYGIKLEIKDE